jgi:hypothetical protein
MCNLGRQAFAFKYNLYKLRRGEGDAAGGRGGALHVESS